MPEIYCERTARYQNLSVYIWWLSVDNYLIHNSFVDRRRANGTLRAIKALLTGKLKDKTDFVKKGKDASVSVLLCDPLSGNDRD